MSKRQLCEDDEMDLQSRVNSQRTPTTRDKGNSQHTRRSSGVFRGSRCALVRSARGYRSEGNGGSRSGGSGGSRESATFPRVLYYDIQAVGSPTGGQSQRTPLHMGGFGIFTSSPGFNMPTGSQGFGMATNGPGLGMPTGVPGFGQPTGGYVRADSASGSLCTGGEDRPPRTDCEDVPPNRRGGRATTHKWQQRDNAYPCANKTP